MPEADRTSSLPAGIFPEYVSGIRIPVNIAPLDFVLPDSIERAWIEVCGGSVNRLFSIRNRMEFPLAFWKRLLAESAASSDPVRIRVVARAPGGEKIGYPPIVWVVEKDSIDPYLTYRLVQPIDGAYNNLTLWQRHLESFQERALISNTRMGNNCFNCHTYHEGNADEMTIHLRKPSEGTLVVSKGNLKKIRLPRTEELKGILPDSLIMPLNFVYSSWHPNGKWIAFCTHILGVGGYGSHKRFINLLDSASNIILYDTEMNRVILDRNLWTQDFEETWPAWSPQGDYLYFCRTAKVSDDTVKAYPGWTERCRHIYFDLARIGFEPESGRFSDTVETLLAGIPGASYSVPRISPDGKYLLVCRALFNSVPYQAEGDLLLLDLEKLDSLRSRNGRQPLRLGRSDELPPIASLPQQLNSSEAESWHKWSHNGKWVVFASKRQDGHYSLPYFSFFDGKGFSKPFVLPQKDARYYQTNLRSFNLPTFVRNASGLDPRKAAEARESDARIIKVSLQGFDK